MDLSKYLTVLVVLCFQGGETGGGGKHHDQVKLHIPEFHHHNHHKKVVTIHHHHHQPKKEQHHHHHHHHKPPMPHEHHYSQHHKKVHLKTKTVTKGTDHHHGSHGHHHNHHGHHHSHEDSSHESPLVPMFSYKPNAIPSYKDDFSSHSPSSPSYHKPGKGFTAPKLPHVHGIAHTVKQVKVFDSLPGALPNLPNHGNGHGYEVTEDTDDTDEVLLSMRNLQNRYPQTFGYVQGLSSQPTYDPFGSITSQNSLQGNHDLFEVSPTAQSNGIESFAGTIQNDPFSSSAPNQNEGLPGVPPTGEFPITFPGSGFDGQVNSFTGTDAEGPSFIAHEENPISAETPVTFAREAGIQQTTKTGNVETIVY